MGMCSDCLSADLLFAKCMYACYFLCCTCAFCCSCIYVHSHIGMFCKCWQNPVSWVHSCDQTYEFTECTLMCERSRVHLRVCMKHRHIVNVDLHFFVYDWASNIRLKITWGREDDWRCASTNNVTSVWPSNESIIPSRGCACRQRPITTLVI